MALADDIEFYGRAVAAGDMERTPAIKALVDASGGVLTERGAADMVENWHNARNRYSSLFDRVVSDLDEIRRKQ